MYKSQIKRLLDILLAILLLPLVLLATLIVAPFIYLEDRGPVFYNAKRIGQNGRAFTMFKFRTMYVDSPDIRLPDGSTYNGENDPRVTRVGRFLRKTSVDELPQVLNVLLGDMSFVGPRPDTLLGAGRYPDEEKIFLSVKPGITGYSQAYFRNSADGFQKVLHDVYYAQNLSFFFDLKIVFKTIQTVLLRENTYKSVVEPPNGSMVKTKESRE